MYQINIRLWSITDDLGWRQNRKSFAAEFCQVWIWGKCVFFFNQPPLASSVCGPLLSPSLPSYLPSTSSSLACGPLFPWPLLYQRPLWSSRLSVFSLSPPKVPSALHRGGRFYIQQGWKGFIFGLDGFILCACACVGGSFYFRGGEMKKKKISQGRPCYADRPVSPIPHLHSSAEWKRSLSPLLPLMYKWVHLVFIREAMERTGRLRDREEVSLREPRWCNDNHLFIIKTGATLLKYKCRVIDGWWAVLLLCSFGDLNDSSDWDVLPVQEWVEMNVFAYPAYLGLSALWAVCASFDPQTRTYILKNTTPPAGVCLAASLPHIEFRACMGFPPPRLLQSSAANICFQTSSRSSTGNFYLQSAFPYGLLVYVSTVQK